MKLIRVLGEELPIKISPTFLQNAACPLYLKFHYVDKVGETFVRIPAERGKAAHEAIALLTTHCVSASCQPEALSDLQIEDAIRRVTPHQILDQLPLLITWIYKWREKFRISPDIYGHEQKLSIDDEFEECSWDDASYRGILDLVEIRSDKHGLITDYKSQPNIMSRQDLQDYEQFTFYSWLLSKVYPDLEAFTCRLFYLRYGFGATTRRTLEDLEQYEHVLMLKESKISEITSWDPMPGSRCNYCDYIHLCPVAMDFSTDNLQVGNQAQAVTAATRLLTMAEVQETLRENLKGWVEANDEVRLPGGNMIYGYKPSVSKAWDAEKLEPILKKSGRSLLEVSNLDTRKMRKLIKQMDEEDPAIVSAIEEIEEEKVKTEFRAYKPDKK